MNISKSAKRENSNIDNFTTLYQGDKDVAILFLHGLGSSPSEVNLFLKYVANKGYSIFAPLLSNCNKYNTADEINSFYPEDGLKEAQKHYNDLAARDNINKIIVVGVSFGGNIAITIASEKPEKLGAIVTLEAPIFFSTKIYWVLRLLQPLCNFLKIKHVRKRKLFYRRGYHPEKGKTNSLIPVTAVGRIFKFIYGKNRQDLEKINAPFLAVQAAKSDLISSRSAKYILDNIQSEKKETFYLPVNNHDLSLMDEDGKILMLEKIERFIESLQ